MRQLKICIALFLVGVLSAQAQLTTGIHYQGRLADTNGAPVTGTITVSLDLYTQATGGTSVYHESVGVITVIDGIYHFSFGDGSSAFMDALAEPECWLELDIDGEIFAPRQRLLAVPYALYASRVVSPQLQFSNGSYLTHDGTNLFMVSVDGSVTNQLTFNAFSPPGTNRPPVAVGDVLTVPAGGNETVHVLSNDYDPDGNLISIISLIQPTEGTVSISGGTSVLYQADTVYTGVDDFFYVITDGQGKTATGSVAVTVMAAAPGNRPPAATADYLSTPQNIAITADVLANDSDPDGDSISLLSFTQPAQGSASNGPSAGSLTYMPALDMTGVVAFTYIIEDTAGARDTGTVQVTVGGERTYMLVDVRGAPTATQYAVSYQSMPPVDLLSSELYKTGMIVLRRVPYGSFVMGSPVTEAGRKAGDADEVQHAVTLSENYYISVFELTQSQYSQIMGQEPAAFGGATRPVESLTWNEIRGGAWPGGVPASTTVLGRITAGTGLQADLPTEAQWEYACRAGTTTALNSAKNLIDPDGDDAHANEVAWYFFNSWDSKHRAPGQRAPNAWNMYDMHGNVYEWCRDWYGSYDSTSFDPSGPASGIERVIRGGSYGDSAESIRSANREAQVPATEASWIGFRIVMPDQYDTNQAPVITGDVTNEVSTPLNASLSIDVLGWVADPDGDALSIGSYTQPESGSVKTNSAGSALIFSPAPNYTGTVTFAFTAADPRGKTVTAYVLVEIGGVPDWMILDVSSATTCEVSYVATLTEEQITQEVYKTSQILFRRIEGDTFTMGSPVSEAGRNSDETQHQVTLNSYYISVYELTQQQYQEVMGRNPSTYTGSMRPVTDVSWNEVRGSAWPGAHPAATSLLGRINGKSPVLFDLPTEAQWEFACRAGTTAALNSGTNLVNPEGSDPAADYVGWYYNNSWTAKHHPVGGKTPNAWWLYDMHGNVSEWCLDWYGGYSGDETEPQGPASGTDRIIRSGTYGDLAAFMRSAARRSTAPATKAPWVGLRLKAPDPFNPNNAPVATDDSTSTLQNVSVDVDIFSNDFDPDSDEFSLSAFTQPGNGSVSWSAATMRFTYQPNSGYSGTDSFTYTIIDEKGDVDTATVQVTVSGTADYIIIDISGGSGASSYPVSYLGAAPADVLINAAYKSTKLVLSYCPAGTFSMGSPGGELGKGSADTDEDQHQVTLTSGFYMGVFEVTQNQFQQVMGYNPSANAGGDRPVDTVSWSAVRGGSWPGGSPAGNTFMGLLRAKTGLSADLPTEAQWEYACRAGTTTSLNSGRNLVDPDGNDPNANEVAWYYHNSWSQKQRTVGQLRGNNWGLYDMHGNVYEWCLDYFNYSGYDYGVNRTDPVGPTSSPYPHRICRGGSFGDPAEAIRSANRYVQQESGAAHWGGFRLLVNQ